MASQLARVLALSPFAADLLRRRPELLAQLCDEESLQQVLPEPAFRENLALRLSEKDADLHSVLRRLYSLGLPLISVNWMDCD